MSKQNICAYLRIKEWHGNWILIAAVSHCIACCRSVTGLRTYKNCAHLMLCTEIRQALSR